MRKETTAIEMEQLKPGKGNQAVCKAGSYSANEWALTATNPKEQLNSAQDFFLTFES